MKVLIIDSNEMRSKALVVVIEQTFNDCITYTQVNGKDEISDNEINKGWESIKDASELLINDCSILFIHHNDNRQQYWRQFVELFLSKDEKNLCVSFSGGDTASQINDRHCPIEKPINDNADGLWHVNDFLLSIKNNENNPFDKLTGFDKFLEVALEFLHKCLSELPGLKLLTDAGIAIDVICTSGNGKETINDLYETFSKKFNLNRKPDSDAGHKNHQAYIQAFEALRDGVLEMAEVK